MKQVVYETPKVVGLSEITDRSNIGIQWNGGDRVMLVETGLAKFAGLGLSMGLTIYGKKTTSSKKEYIEEALLQKNTKVFVFETPFELLEWMADRTRTSE